MTEVVAELENSLTLQERRDYSVVEDDMFNDGKAYDTQDNADSSAKGVIVNGEHHDKEIGTAFHGGRMNFAKKLKQFFLVTPRPISRNSYLNNMLDCFCDTLCLINVV